MSKWRTQYRCRRCGKVYDDAGWIASNIEVVCTIDTVGEHGKAFPGGKGHGLYLHEAHHCDDGGYGLADFVGVAPEDGDEQ